MVEIEKALELRLGLRRKRGLWMRSKQLIATLSKPLERIRSVQPVEVADAAAPIGEVDVVLGSALSQRFLP